jgi:hypothetical protein
MRPTEKGKHYGEVTAKAFAAYSTVSAAIRALEAAGLLEWVNRLKRVREWAPGVPGIGASRVRVLRTSNAWLSAIPGQIQLLSLKISLEPRLKFYFLP